MAVNQEGGAVFCAGCDMKGYHCGEVSSAAIEIETPELSEGWELTVRFADDDRKVSRAAEASAEDSIAERTTHIRPDKLVQIGRTVSSRCVSRIKRCSGPSSDDKGRLHCPAFNDTIFQELVDEAISERQ